MQLRNWTAIAGLGAMLLFGVGTGSAQSGTSSVQGTVTDSTGAVVPDSSVQLTNNGTGVTLQSRSDQTGNYSFPSVPPGLYTLQVTKDGFATYKITGFNVIVGQHQTQDAKLSVASSSTVVTVDASGLSNLLDPQSNDLGTVIGPHAVENLPLNGRNFLQLSLLSGAAATPQGAAAGSTNQTGHPYLAINVAGNEPDYTMYLVNGIETVGSRAGNSSLNIDTGAIDQFEVHYGFFMPDMGTNPGIVDVVTKSGTNHIHGEVYEYLRTNQMEARDYFAINPGTNTPIPPGEYHQNQFGFNAGGPILHDKLFYFASYEGYRENQQQLLTGEAPTQAMLGGDFSALLPGTVIYDPATLDPTTGRRQPFTGNMIPSGRISDNIKGLLAFYTAGAGTIPAPKNVGGNRPYTFNSDQFMGRIDSSLNERNQIFAQGNWLNSPILSPGLFPSTGVSYPMDTELVNLGWNWSQSANRVNELRVGMMRDSVFDEGASVPGIQNKLNITGTGDPNGVPSIGFSGGGLSGFGVSTGLLGDVDNVYQIHDGFNWLHGNHQFKFGIQYDYLRSIQASANANARGAFNFNGMFTAQTIATSNGYATDNSYPGGAGGYSFADFLLGDLNTGQSIAMPSTHFRWTTVEPYAQDTWKITPHLTANLALAWYGATPPNPVGPDKNLIHAFDFDSGLLIFTALGQVNPEVFPMTKTDFAPRVGFSYQPPILPNMVVRAGWGFYYTTQQDVNAQYSIVSQVITINNAVSNVQGNPQYVLGVNAMPSVTVGQITQAQANAMTGPVQYLATNQVSPYIDQYNFDVQYSFAKSNLADVSYLGNNAHHLAVNWNPFDCSSPADQYCVDSRIPYNDRYSYMQEVNSIGFGNYNALLAKFQHQFQHGFSLMANYVWEKGLAEAQQGSNGTVNQNRSCLRCDYGLTTSNIPQALVISTVVNLPVGHGRVWGNDMNPVLNQVIGGWSVDAIGTMQRGLPYTITGANSTDWSPGQIRANRYCHDPHAGSYMSQHGLSRNIRTNGNFWFWNQQTGGVFQNETGGGCFVDPAKDPANLVNGKLPVIGGVQARDAFGDGGFDPYYGPGLNNWDIAVHKEFAIEHGVAFALRGEFFNAWNHAQFANPNTGVNAGAGFGQITSSQHAARIVQVAGKLTF
ncbi:MAG: carboxypeptidase-like regulatory domain-containing protein [Acidobacteriaceae bacterium]